MITSTSYVTLAFPGKRVCVLNLGTIYWWLLSNEDVLPDVFWSRSLLHFNLLLLHTEKKTAHHVSPQNPKNANVRCEMREKKKEEATECRLDFICRCNSSLRLLWLQLWNFSWKIFFQGTKFYYRSCPASLRVFPGPSRSINTVENELIVAKYLGLGTS